VAGPYLKFLTLLSKKSWPLPIFIYKKPMAKREVFKLFLDYFNDLFTVRITSSLVSYPFFL